MTPQNRRNVTWDLSKGSQHTLTCYWIELNEVTGLDESRHMVLTSLDGPWQPWQIAGVRAALENGRPLAEVANASDAPKPPVSVFRRAAWVLEDTVLGALDLVSRRASVAGGPW